MTLSEKSLSCEGVTPKLGFSRQFIAGFELMQYF
jgi:hypothetical protein